MQGPFTWESHAGCLSNIDFTKDPCTKDLGKPTWACTGGRLQLANEQPLNDLFVILQSSSTQPKWSPCLQIFKDPPLLTSTPAIATLPRHWKRSARKSQRPCRRHPRGSKIGACRAERAGCWFSGSFPNAFIDVLLGSGRFWGIWSSG